MASGGAAVATGSSLPPNFRANQPSDFYIQDPRDFQQRVERWAGFPVLDMANTRAAKARKLSQLILRNPLFEAYCDQPSDDGIDNFLFTIGRHRKTLPGPPVKDEWP